MKSRITIIAVVLAAVAVLAGCSTTGTNAMLMEAHQEALATQRAAIQQHEGAAATAAAACNGDTTCVVSVTAIFALSRPDIRIEQPRLRSSGQEFAQAFTPVANLASTGLQIFGAGWLVDRSGQNMVDVVNASAGLVGQVGTVVGGLQSPVDNSVTVGGNYGDTDNSTDVGGNLGDTDQSTDIGRDSIGGDQRVGDDIEGSCIGDACRNTSPGPIDFEQNDNSDNSTNPAPEPDP